MIDEPEIAKQTLLYKGQIPTSVIAAISLKSTEYVHKQQ